MGSTLCRYSAVYRPSGHRGPEITFKEVKFWYQMRPNTMVINAMNMTVPGGSTAALVGKSGVGQPLTPGRLHTERLHTERLHTERLHTERLHTERLLPFRFDFDFPPPHANN
jgi:ABC-type microcin C transport system duplicated ATPase subunit YejF